MMSDKDVTLLYLDMAIEKIQVDDDQFIDIPGYNERLHNYFNFVKSIVSSMNNVNFIDVDLNNHTENLNIAINCIIML